MINLYAHNKNLCKEIAEKADIVIFQRPDATMGFLGMLIDNLLEFNPNLTIIGEFDDLILFSHIHNYGLDFQNKFISNFPIICSTPYLAELIRVQNPMAEIYLYRTKLPYRDEEVIYSAEEQYTILHTGTSTHYYDVNNIAKSLEYLLKKNSNYSVLFWGNKIPKNLMDFNRVKDEEFISNYEEYVDNFINLPVRFGINPLSRTRHNWCKSNIKYIEYGQKATPALFTDMPEYVASVAVPELIVRSGEWGTKIDWLLSLDHTQLREIGMSMAEDVKENWTMTEADLDLYFDILTSSIELTTSRKFVKCNE